MRTDILKALLFIAMIAFAAAPAAADVCTTHASGKPNLSCNDPAFPKCMFNPARSEWKCICRNCIPCGSPARTWNCNPGGNCNGDGTTEPVCRR